MSDRTPLESEGVFWSAIERVHAERRRQDDKWGSQRDLPPATWHLILSEEVGEVAEACLGVHDTKGVSYPELRAELVQVAAVAIAWLEALEAEATA